MNLPKKILFLFFVLGIISIIANTLNYNSLMCVTRIPLAILIYIYYYLSTKKINYTFTAVLFLFFLSDLVLLFLDNTLLLIAIAFFSYILFLILGLKGIVKFKPTVINVVSLLIVIIFITFLYVNILELIVDQQIELKIPFTIYGFVLSLCAIVGSYNLIFRNRKYDFYYFLSISTFVITDVFFVVNKFYYTVDIFVFLSFIIQIVSYFFMVKFMLAKEVYSDDNKIM